MVCGYELDRRIGGLLLHLRFDTLIECGIERIMVESQFDSAMLITPVMKFQDQYYVQMDSECRLINCSVDKTQIQPSGELVGIHKLSNRFYKQVISEYARVVEEKPKLGYEFQLLLTSQKGVSGELPPEAIMNVLKIDGLKWYEIDDQNDLEFAEKNVGIE